MHPFFENLNYYPLRRQLKTEELCISILEDLELIPKKNDAPACPECSGGMEAVDHEIAWLWKCIEYTCPGTINPLRNTFFEDIQLPLRVTLYIIVCKYGFVRRKDLVMILPECFDMLRGHSLFKSFKRENIEYIFDKCKKVCEIIMSQKHERMTGPYRSTLYLMYLKRTLKAPKLNCREKSYAFLMDVKAVYPGHGKIGLNYKHFSTSSSTSG